MLQKWYLLLMGRCSGVARNFKGGHNFTNDKVKSADIRESLNIEALLLRLERSQLRWYGHVTRMSQERTAKKLLCSTPIGRRLEAVPELDGEIT